MRISISTGPDVSDPLDLRPIIVSTENMEFFPVMARTWRARLAIWYLRKYVKNIFHN